MLFGGDEWRKSLGVDPPGKSPVPVEMQACCHVLPLPERALSTQASFSPSDSCLETNVRTGM